MILSISQVALSTGSTGSESASFGTAQLRGGSSVNGIGACSDPSGDSADHEDIDDCDGEGRSLSDIDSNDSVLIEENAEPGRSTARETVVGVLASGVRRARLIAMGLEQGENSLGSIDKPCAAT